MAGSEILKKPESLLLPDSAEPVKEASRCIVFDSTLKNRMIIALYAGDDSMAMSLDVPSVLSFRGMINAWLMEHSKKNAEVLH